MDYSLTKQTQLGFNQANSCLDDWEIRSSISTCQDSSVLLFVFLHCIAEDLF